MSEQGPEFNPTEKTPTADTSELVTTAVTEAFAAEKDPTLKERFNAKINGIADRVWEQSLQKGDLARQESNPLVKAVILQSLTIDALNMEVLDSLARASGGRVVRSELVAQRLPNLNRQMFKVEPPQGGTSK